MADFNEMSFIKAPVTALCFVDDYLFAGIGSFVKVYSRSDGQIHLVEKVFSHQVVHGIKLFYNEDCSFVAIFGGQELVICELNFCAKKHGLLKVLSSFNGKKWIWDVAFVFENVLSCNVPTKVALALSHNSVVLYDWQDKSLVTEVHCEEKCILYSAHFIRELRSTWQSLTVCGGTVFNQVVIWKPGTVDDGTSMAVVVERIQAHDGVIFSMDFDVEFGFLVTASDDRSIRIWNCSSLARFCSNPRPRQSTEYLCKLYGHGSRVWRARSFKFDGKQYLVSIGEDRCCILWEITGLEGSGQLEGRIIRKIKYHKGRNIWSLAICNNKGFLATGGGDGGIRMWSIDDSMRENIVTTRHPFYDVCSKLDPDLGSLKSIHLCDSESLLAHTDAGVLLHFRLQKFMWNVLSRDENYKSYSVMRVCNDTNVVALGNTEGEVCCLLVQKAWSDVACKTKFKATKSEGKIHNMSWFLFQGDPHIFVSGANGEFACFKVEQNISSSNAELLSCEKLGTWALPPAKHRWHMGAVLAERNGVKYVLCGDRRGSLHLYKEGVVDPLHSIHGVHGKNGVTSVQSVGRFLISTGRDGLWRTLGVDFENEKIKILAQNRAAQGMDWLESATPVEKMESSLVILGFHGRHFTAWSSATGDTLLSIECGGGHRDWSFVTELRKSYLAFIKESTLHIARVFRDVTQETSIVEPHFHGEQVTSIQHIDSFIEKSTQRSVAILATGSEDTKVFISAFLRKNGGKPHLENELRILFVIDDHISSVRALVALNLENTSENSTALLFTGGGRAAINCYLMKIDKRKDCAKSCTVERAASHSLNAGLKKLNQSDFPNPETRYMDLTAWRYSDSIFLATACSDAVIRLFYMDLQDIDLQLIGQSPSYAHCFLTIQHFWIGAMSFIATGATDGHVRIWHIQQTKAPHDTNETFGPPVFETKLHMSGINALDILEKPISQANDTVLLATGGDDNSIQLAFLRFENTTFDIFCRCSVENAHSTQVTGLKLLLARNPGKVDLVSTSIDQRLTKWSISITVNALNYEFVSSDVTNIADVCSLEIWSDVIGNSPTGTCCAISGQGIQIFR